MVLTWTSTASKNVSLPASATVVVQAKGQQCNGAPSMAIKVDGVTIGTHTVSATSWTSYTSSRKISAGSHTIRVSFTNQYQTLKCARRLSVDAVTVVPEVTVPTTATSPMSDDTQHSADKLDDEYCANHDDHLGTGSHCTEGQPARLDPRLCRRLHAIGSEGQLGQRH